MKSKFIITLFALILPLAGIAHGQAGYNLMAEPPAVQIAKKINESQIQTLVFVEQQLKRLYAAVNTEGLQQEILDQFGTGAVGVLQRYQAVRTLLVTLDPAAADRIPDADVTVFVPNEDGTVTYVAPPEPEPEPAPAE